MAPVKRARPTADDDDVVVAVDTASSSLRIDPQRKKARLSGISQGSSKYDQPASEHIDSASSSDDEVDEETNTEAPDEFVPPSTQYDIDRDAGFVHLEDSSRDDELATQRLLARTRLLGENHAADNGIIESVTMTNFMCHDKLHVTLGPLMNFIIGPNGSGKSAILTAMTLCLGGKASTTNRGGSLKSFIKEGRDQANLIIRLKNQGLDAYQHDVFGDSIIVERNFTKAGASGFKLKNAAGRLISNKKADVDEVIEYFQMQIDNPMNVLTQDAARQFLNAATPSQKYRFFVKGVQLEQLDNDYRLVSETSDAMLVKLEVIKEQVKVLQRKSDAAKEKMRIVNEHQSMRNAMHKYSKQLAWAQVEEEEDRLREREGRVLETERGIENAERDVQLKSETYERANDAAERADDAVKQISEEMSPLREQEAEAKTSFDGATQEVQNMHLEHRQIRDHLQTAKKKVESFQQDINAEHKRLEDATGGAHTQKLIQLDQLRNELSEIKTKFDENAGQRPILENQYQLALEELEKHKVPMENKRKEISAGEKQLEALMSDADQVMAGFDKRMPRLLNMIRDDRGFKEKPVGPIGLHIKLLQPIWSTILERSIGNMLSGFIVTSMPDQQRLTRMTRQLGIDNCPVIIGNHQAIDTRNHEPDEQYLTVLRVLDIDNDLVRKQLIITQGIEQTILVEDRAVAVRILYDGAKPRNVKQCFCINDNKRGWGYLLGYMAGSGEGKSSPINPNPGAKPRMKTDIDSQIAYQKETLQHLKREFASLQGRQRELQQGVDRLSRSITQQKQTHNSLQVQKQRNQEESDRLQEELDRDNVEDGRLEALRGFLKEAEEEVAIHSGSYQEAVLAKERQNTISLSMKRNLDAVREKIVEHETKIKKAEGKAKRNHQARLIALHEKNIAINALEEANSQKTEAEQKRERQELRVADFIEQASKISPRVPVDAGETAASLDARLVKLNEALQTYNRKLGGTDNEILLRCEEAQKAFETAESQQNGLEELSRSIKRSYFQRLRKWRRFQRHISASSRINFTYLLSERGFRGRLKLDHKHKLLDVEIEPDETRKSSKGRATKTLSGGEKSFSSICLLLSLWEAMGAPLRCLDEFDVFMDNVNRDVSTNMIIGAARRSVGKQFIIITPNKVGGNADHEKDVRIIRLFDPRQHLLANP